MREKTGIKFLDDLFAFLDDAIDSGAEVHIVDKSDPNCVVEHVFNADGEDDFGPDDIEEVPFGDDDEAFYYGEECSTCMADSCSHCPYDEDGDIEPDMWGIPDIRRVVFNDPATIVFWDDGTKTVVRCMDGEKYERYAGFIAACAKKMFGSTSRAKAIMEECAYDQPAKVKKERVAGLREKVNPVDDAVGIDHETIMEAVDEALNG